MFGWLSSVLNEKFVIQTVVVVVVTAGEVVSEP